RNSRKGPWARTQPAKTGHFARGVHRLYSRFGDPSTSKYGRTRLFMLTLGYSRKCVRLLVWRSSAQAWAELQERAFRRLGGTVRVVVPRQSARGRAHPGHL